jgi:hypothetical protein
MQPARDIDEKAEKGVPIQASSLSHEGGDSVTSVEAANENLKAKGLTRKLLRKLDTRCVFDFFLHKYTYN